MFSNLPNEVNEALPRLGHPLLGPVCARSLSSLSSDFSWVGALCLFGWGCFDFVIFTINIFHFQYHRPIFILFFIYQSVNWNCRIVLDCPSRASVTWTSAIRWPCFNQIYLAQIYLTLFCPNVFCSNIFWPNPFCSNIFCLNIFCSNIFCPNIFDPVLPKYIKTYHPYPCEKNAYTKKIFSLSSPLLCNLSLFWPLGALKAICFGYCQNILFPHYSY